MPEPRIIITPIIRLVKTDRGIRIRMRHRSNGAEPVSHVIQRRIEARVWEDVPNGRTDRDEHEDIGDHRDKRTVYRIKSTLRGRVVYSPRVRIN